MECVANKQLSDMKFIVTQMIKDYKWRKQEVKRLQRIVYGVDTPMKNWGVAQYGIEAAMPKGSKGKSLPEIKRIESLEEKRIKRLKRYECEVYLLETLADIFETEMQKVIYDCLLEGENYRSIGMRLGVAKSYVMKQKQEIIIQLCKNEEMETFLLYGEID